MEKKEKLYFINANPSGNPAAAAAVFFVTRRR
jgi:hypothetical protein